MAKELCFITVIGKDKKGIVARISNALFEANINIEDVDMKVMEGYFVMSMFVDVAESKLNMDEIKERMGRIEREMNLKIQVQHEEIFKTMHRV
ncbi:MAG: ACT domain-containing protein [Candidatus Altiarchaeota archaeon]|nr:ACT domain-containing protein [Candidatus Altiarchaeota archaeon]